MKQATILTTTSLLSILFMTFHLTDDILGSLLGPIVRFVHMKGAGDAIGGEIAKSSEAFFFVWTLLALGVTGMFSVALSVRAVWSLPWRRPTVPLL